MTNYRKRTRTLKLQHDDDGVSGRSHSVGHAWELGAGIHVYDEREPDRPASVLVQSVEDARVIIDMMQTYITAYEALGAK